MKRRLPIRLIASTVMLYALSPAAAFADSDNDLVLFGKDPGDAKAFACYTRRYDAPHLASHPQQNVRDMTVFVNSFYDKDVGRQYDLEIGVHFRKRKALFQLSGGCSASADGTSALTCGIDCDGGRIDVQIKDATSILVSIPDGARTTDPGEPAPKGTQFWSDDKIFRLDRTRLPDCLPLVSDDDKAAVAAGK